MLPKTFEEWVVCITQKCKINLTKGFAKSRLSIYLDANHLETQRFVQLYGMEHLQNIISWLKKI